MSPVTVGVSLKTYFSHRAAKEWMADAADIASRSPGVAAGRVEFFVAPTYLQLLPAMEAAGGTRTIVAAQDVSEFESGAYTGEVTAAELAEIGVGIVEIGHAERRRLFGDTDHVVARKTASALSHGLTPLLCVGEPTPMKPEDALAFSWAQVQSALAEAPAGRVILAYEPVWAIGEPSPAPVAHTRAVCRGLREALGELDGRDGSTVIYGGSAGPGLLTELGEDVGGIFLGRFAHEPAALARVLAEADSIAAS